MRQLRRCFTRHVGVDKMIADNAARFSKPLFRALHILIAIFYCAVDRALQNHFIIQRSFVGIFNVVQRTGERGFIAVLNIAQTVTQPCTDGNDFVIGHQSVSRIKRYACFTRLTASWISACVAQPLPFVQCAIWLILLPMADNSRRSAAYASGGRGQRCSPMISLRRQVLVFRPVIWHCFFKWASSVSFSHSPTDLQRVRIAFSFLI